MVSILEIKWLKWLLAIIGAAAILIAGLFIYVAFLLPLPGSLTSPIDYPTTKIYDRNGELLYEVLNPDHGRKTYLTLDQIPQSFIDATLASEDAAFFQHHGVDISAIARAAFFNVLEQRITSGASTITQQLVRNLLGLNRERTLSEKLKEAAYAIRLNFHFSKDQVLEKYLNTVYYGSMSYGAQAAALNYFDRNLYDLDLAHHSFLAGLPQAPTRYNPYQNFKAAKKRQRYVLDQMINQGFITQDEAEIAHAQPLTLRRNITEIKAPHFVHHVINQLDQEFGPDAVNYGGLEVTTTLDHDLQLDAEAIITRNLEKLADKDVGNGALLAAHRSSSEALAWVGSANYFDDEIAGQVDMITALRQPGSALKPFLYLLAFQNGYTPASILDDIPISFETDTGPYSPKNYDLDYHGPVRIREALANSFNIPAVQLLNELGLVSFITFLQSFGFESLDRAPEFYGLSVTLGGGEVRLYEMVRAFNTIASGGQHKDLQTIKKVTQNGIDLTPEAPKSEQILAGHAAQSTYLLTDILSDPDARLRSFGEGNVLELSFPAAVKTGTTRNFRDNWTVGYSPEITVGVWVGNADATPMKNISGIDGAGPIWRDFMEQSKTDSKPFRRPSGIIEATICADSGLLTTDLCARPLNEIFVQGTAPAKQDNYYQEFECGPEKTREIHIVYPIRFQKWAEDRDLTPPPNCRPTKPQPEAAQLMITSPIPQDSFAISTELPQESQKIPIRYTLGTSATGVTIYINDAPIEQGPKPAGTHQHFWLPEKGLQKLKIEATTAQQEILTTPTQEFDVK